MAASIAQRTGACIDVVHVYEQMTDFHPENQRLRDDLEAKLDRVPELPFHARSRDEAIHAAN
ncbi:MAG: hypothetical protein IPJ85_07345 [Flavobacteriales bacterium]|nr:hypothetical protein [Flavobacteriales bacterium]